MACKDLHTAALYGHIKCLTSYLEQGINVDNGDNSVFSCGGTALMHAAYAGQISCLLELLKWKACVNASDDSGDTALMYTAMSGTAECLGTLLQFGAKVNLSNIKKTTPLMYASYFGHIKCVKRLLEGGANVNDVDSDGFNSLSKAMLFGYTDIVCELLIAGADINNVGEDGVTPLMTGAMMKYEDMEELVCSVGKTFKRERHDRPGAMSLLIEAGGNVNCVDRTNRSVLMILAEMDDPDSIKCVEILLRSRVKCETTEDYSDSIQDAGAIVNTEKVDVNCKDIHGNTALLHATSVSNLQVVRLLIEAGASVNCKEETGSTALHMAARNGDMECVEMLIRAGGNVNATDENGDTVPMVSDFLDKENVKFLQLLLKSGYVLNRVNFQGQTIITHDLDAFDTYRARSTSFKLLQAAGEKVTREMFLVNANDGVPWYIEQNKLSLKETCMSAIRKHLIDVDERTNLFVRIPKLPLPGVVKNELLFRLSLDKEVEEEP